VSEAPLRPRFEVQSGNTELLVEESRPRAWSPAPALSGQVLWLVVNPSSNPRREAVDLSVW